MKSIMKFLMVSMLFVLFAGCSKDNDESVDDSNKAVAFSFSLRFEDAEGAVDQPDLITTAYSYVNYQGNKESDFFTDEFLEDLTVTSQKYTSLPGEVEIVITETLNPEVELTQESYKVGLSLQLHAVSYAADDAVVDFGDKAMNWSMAVPASNLSKLYPKTIRLKFTVAKDGKITIQ